MRSPRPPPPPAPWPGSLFGSISPSSPPDPVPAGVSRRLVVPRQGMPVRTGHAVEVVDHLAVAQRHLADEPFRPPQARAVRVHEPEAARLQAQHREVGGRAPRQEPPPLPAAPPPGPPPPPPTPPAHTRPPRSGRS